MRRVAHKYVSQMKRLAEKPSSLLQTLLTSDTRKIHKLSSVFSTVQISTEIAWGINHQWLHVLDSALIVPLCTARTCGYLRWDFLLQKNLDLTYSSPIAELVFLYSLIMELPKNMPLETPDSYPVAFRRRKIGDAEDSGKEWGARKGLWEGRTLRK